jgi:ABC-2 type transport system ATP-binding protein
MYAIECDGVSKVYRKGGRKVAAVEALTLQIAPRQVYGFLGPNGAGKTTTIRMLLNLVRPTAGQLRLFGQPVHDNPAALRKVGALVEGANFYPYLSGWDNLRVLGWSGGAFDPAQAQHVLHMVNLQGREHDRVSKYSTGMKQRLGIAAALLHQPNLVILDEPTNGLDPAAIHTMRAFVRHLVDDEGKTVFLSSHLLNEVQQICDRVGIIHQGRLLAEGRVEDLLNEHSQPYVWVEAVPLASAQVVLAAFGPVKTAEDHLAALQVQVGRERIPAMVGALVDAGIAVYQVQERRSTLEAYFLRLTASDSFQADQLGGT